eukprot:TRINITY_DN13813_c0_g1_i1.p1 TRINITY_DN13813_c0_g1~~TRINITY_DN13813_c0_g1_i1.p1  ORF type:complete len:567 (-),score=108.04 TRINITY_DN13813_c0_g1_i1:4-1557(-)
MKYVSKKTVFFIILFVVYNLGLFAYNRLDLKDDRSEVNEEVCKVPVTASEPPPPTTPSVQVEQTEEVIVESSQEAPEPQPTTSARPSERSSWECEIQNDGLPHLVTLPITFEEALLKTPRVCNEVNRPLHLTYDQIRSLRSKNYFVALNLYQNADVSPHLYTQLLKLMHFLSKRPRSYDESEADEHGMCIDKSAPTFENFFVSIYESGSEDDTAVLGDFFEEKLRGLGVAHRIALRATDIPSHRQDPKINRIDFMAAIRNKALEPLYDDAYFKYNKVIFLNDVYFCWQDAVRLVVNDGIDMACGLDVGWRTDFNTFGFYDTWVSKDKTGNFINFLSPFFQRPEDQDRLLQGLPVPMFCCWNGMTAIDADVFYPPYNIRFRRSPQRLYRNDPKEACDGAECSVFCFDLFKNGFMDIIMDPHVVSTYEPSIFYKAMELRSWPNDNSDRKIDPADIVSYSTPVDVSKIPFTNKFPDAEWCCPVSQYQNGAIQYFDCYVKQYKLSNVKKREEKTKKSNEQT